MEHLFKGRRAAGALALTLLLVLAGIVAACGGDGDSSAATTSPAASAANPSASASTAAPAASFPVTVTDSAGTAVTFAEAPKRIISFSPGATEILFAVGAGSQVVAVDKFADYPPETARLPKLEYSKPAPEPAVALNPDLVIMATRQEGQVQQFRSLGMRVLLLREPADLESVAGQVRTIGKVTGHGSEAERLASQMEKRIRTVQEKLGKVVQGPKVFYEISPDGYTSGPGTFIASMLLAVKATNIAGGAATAFPQLSAEVIIASNPDVILLTDGGDAGGQSLETVRARPGWGSVPAVKNGRVYVVDPNVFTRPGPRVVDALEQLAKLLYPEIP